MTTKPPCSEPIWSNFATHPCSRNGSVERDGKWYCKQHDPIAIKARRDEAQAAYNQKSEREKRIREATAALDAARDALVESVVLSHAIVTFPKPVFDSVRAYISARTALEAAKQE